MLQYAPLTSQEWQEVEKLLQRREYQQGEVLLTEGKICRKLYFLESGFLRFFSLRDGEEVTKFFTNPPYCFTSQRSFNQGIPAQESISTLEDSVVWELSRSAVDYLSQFPGWNNFALKLVQEVQFYTQELMEALQNETAETRYARLIETQSPLLEKVPLKYLASYLGIAPQSLSRIRKKFQDRNRS